MESLDLEYCKYCRQFRSPNFIVKGDHIGMYCSYCNHWIQWVSKEYVEQKNIKVTNPDKCLKMY